MRASPVSANRAKALLSHVFSKAIEWGVVESNPCKVVRAFPERPRTRYVTDAEYRAALKLAPASLRVFMEFAYLTGARLGDIRSLTRQQLSDEGITYVAGKTRKLGNRPRMVRWSPRLRAVVAEAQSLHKKVARMNVFVTETGLVWSEPAFRSAWSRLIRKAMKEGVLTQSFHFHDLRAKAASDRPTDEDARKALGHSDVKTTQGYRRAPETVEPTR
jgi:integrase